MISASTTFPPHSPLAPSWGFGKSHSALSPPSSPEATSPRPHVGAKSEERGKQPVGKMASKAAPPPLSRTLILPLFLWLHADCVVVGNRMGDGRVDCDCHDRHKTSSLHFRCGGPPSRRNSADTSSTFSGADRAPDQISSHYAISHHAITPTEPAGIIT